jgi:hypothetical protein
MNVADTRSEMLACVDELRQRLAATPDPARRTGLADETRRQIERLRKRFKHRIDEKANQRFGFSINAREGIERKLAEATAIALAAVEQALADHAQPPDRAGT